MPVTVLGLDLSGPANSAHTAAVVAQVDGSALHVRTCLVGLTDREIVTLLRSTSPDEELVFALDAPLSYNDGGGDRPADKQLRARIMAAGLASGSVMAPTQTRMAYLTLRGLAVARLLHAEAGPRARIVEVHPGAAMALRGAPVHAVRTFAKDEVARRELLVWLSSQGVVGLGAETTGTSHQVAAAAAALAGWKWATGCPCWSWSASPPQHPFDFAC